jgi:hypothetical protein
LYSSVLFNSAADFYNTRRFEIKQCMNNSYQPCIQVFYSIQQQIFTRIGDIKLNDRRIDHIKMVFKYYLSFKIEFLEDQNIQKQTTDELVVLMLYSNFRFDSGADFY